MCDKGVRKRLISCYETNENGTIVKLEDEECSNQEELKKPEEEEECEAETECQTYDWISTLWSGCGDEEEGEAICGAGIKNILLRFKLS